MLHPSSELVLALVLAACAAPSGAESSREASPSQSVTPAAGVLGFYRYPALHGDTIVFAAEGDLWKVSAEGGVAGRLTTHPEEERFPVISPDGATLAFSASYEGPVELYTMPLAGGSPVRRTFEADASIATTWTPDGRLVYATQHYNGLPKLSLVSLDLEDGTRSRVPLLASTEGSYDDTGKTLFFVRPAFHRNVTKRYRGGTARDVWRFAEGDEEAVELTGDYIGESHSPMWWAKRVYFVSDRDGTMNVWSIDENGGDAQQHTNHSGWDVKNPDLFQGRIVYQLGADLWLYDIAADRAGLVPITLASDFDQLREKWITKPMEHLTSAHLHPKGESVVLTSRGRVFVAPAEQGRLVRASRKDGVRFRDVCFLPDGDSLLGLSDESGELEFTKLPANGVGQDKALTADGKILRFRGHPSPDGKWIAYRDNGNVLWVLEVETKEQRKISTLEEDLGDLAWSPDGRWLAWVQAALNSFEQIHLYDTREGTSTPLTSDRVNSSSPAWDPGGKFLYFLSDRHLSTLVPSPWGTRQPEPYFDKPIGIYHVSLQAGTRSPFKPDDELSEKTEKKQVEKKDETGEEQKKTAKPVAIDLEGLPRRVKPVPIPAGNYRSLAVTDKALFLTARDSGPGAKTHLLAVKIANQKVKAEPVVEDVRSFELSLDGKKLLVRKGSDFFVLDAKPGKAGDLGEHQLDLSGWTYSIDVREDWRQIFVDAWRLERDYFYDPGMHNVDWDGTLAKYLPLVDRVTTRDELSDLIGRVVGELSALHTSVRGGDLREGPDEVSVATLGARLFRDPTGGGYRIDAIYQHDPDYPEEAAPLADPDLGVAVGDVILKVNGVGTLEVADIGALLRNQQGRQVLLQVQSGGESRELIVVPGKSERNLRYADWELTCRQAVEERGEGQLGYVHLRSMGGSDINAWYRQFYPVYNRKGLILDVRNNYGGNIDSIVLEKLLRRAWMFWKPRAGAPYPNMQYAFRGHLVILVDQNTYSDGEAIAEGFRRLGLGPVIGMRTWGGEIWLGSSNRLTDGGLARAPMTGVYGPEREWLIEQIGVIPDIEVDNLPHATFLGGDAQLDRAIEYLKTKIAEDPRDVPEPPPYPDWSFEYPEDGE